MIVVTAPTGTTGHQVVEKLLDSAEPIRVIARDPSHLPPEERERVEVVATRAGSRSTAEPSYSITRTRSGPNICWRASTAWLARDAMAVAFLLHAHTKNAR